MTGVDLPAPSPADELRRRAHARDVALLLALPAVLVGAWAAGEPARAALVLRPEQPTVLAAFGAHFVHASADHLLGNLVVYAGAVGLGYPLAVLGGSRRRYVTMVVGVVLVVPPVGSGFHLLVIGTGDLLGASAVTLALVGLLPPMLFEFRRARVSGTVDLGGAVGGFLLGFAAVGWPGAGAVPNGRWLAAAVGLVGLVALAPTARRRWRRRMAADGPAAGRELGWRSAGAVGLLFLSVAAGVGSPVDLAASTLHLLAYGSAFVGAFGAIRYHRLRPRPVPPAEAG